MVNFLLITTSALTPVPVLNGSKTSFLIWTRN